MLIGVNPAETVWRSWSEIQKERIRLDRQNTTTRRETMQKRLEGVKVEEEAITAALRPFDELLASLDAEEASLVADTQEPAFQIGHLPWAVRGRVAGLYTTGKTEDVNQAVALLVRHGCRGHRQFTDGSGVPVPLSFESSKGHFPVLAQETFEVYAASGVAEPLASVILDYNSLGKSAQKN